MATTKKTAAEEVGPRPAIVIPKGLAPDELYSKLDDYVAHTLIKERRLIKSRPAAVVEILCNFFSIKNQ